MKFEKKYICPLIVMIKNSVGRMPALLARRVRSCLALSLPVLFLAALAWPLTAAGSNLALSGGQIEEDQQAVFTLDVQKAGNPVAAFRLDIDYDVTALRFKEAVAGPLAAGKFELFRAFNQAPGVVRIGGVSPQSPAIKKNDTGVLVKLFFEVRSSGECDLAITGLRNDMKHWQAGSCSFEAVQPAADPGRDAEKNETEKAEKVTDEDVAPEFQPAAGLSSGHDDEILAATGSRQEDYGSGTDMSENPAEVSGAGQSPGSLGSGNTAAFFSQEHGPWQQRDEAMAMQTSGQAGLPAQADPGEGRPAKSSRPTALPTAVPGDNNRGILLADNGNAMPNPSAKKQSMAAGLAGSRPQKSILPSWGKFFWESFQPAATLSLQAVTLLVLLRLLQEFKRRQRKMEHLLARVVSPSNDGMPAPNNESFT